MVASRRSRGIARDAVRSRGALMWKLAKSTVLAFIDDEALSRGAAIAFYTVTSIAPILLIVVAVAGLVFGREAAHGAITAPIGGLMVPQPDEVVQGALGGVRQ